MLLLLLIDEDVEENVGERTAQIWEEILANQNAFDRKIVAMKNEIAEAKPKLISMQNMLAAWNVR